MVSDPDGPDGPGESVPADELAAMRETYVGPALVESDVPDDPMVLLAQWLADAVAAGLAEPNAMVLATVDPDGRPGARIVLLKELDGSGLSFFTNLNSRKARALAAHPYAAIVLPWHAMRRQVRVEGRVDPVERAEAEAYWLTRPFGSRLGSWASHQSEPVADRAALDAAWADAAARFPDGAPLPEFWGGYRIVPDRVEFWQGRPDRLHDRLVYVSDAAGWTLQRLAP